MKKYFFYPKSDFDILPTSSKNRVINLSTSSRASDYPIVTNGGIEYYLIETTYSIERLSEMGMDDFLFFDDINAIKFREGLIDINGEPT